MAMAFMDYVTGSQLEILTGSKKAAAVSANTTNTQYPDFITSLGIGASAPLIGAGNALTSIGIGAGDTFSGVGNTFTGAGNAIGSIGGGIGSGINSIGGGIGGGINSIGSGIKSGLPLLAFGGLAYLVMKGLK
jgi:hypothetical protein